MTDRKTRDLELPNDRDSVVALQLAMLAEATKEWREELGEMDVSEDAVVWQAFPKGHSIGALILHMIETEIYWVEEIAAGRGVPEEEYARYMSKEIDQYKFSWPVPPRKPLQWFLDQQDAVRVRGIETIRGIGDPMHLSARRDEQLTLRSILTHLMVHEAYHGGQAVLLAAQHAQRAESIRDGNAGEQP